MTRLIIVRHGKSEWNALGLWTGWEDIPLIKDGEEEAQRTAEQLKDICIHRAYSSKLKRASETLKIIQDTLQISHIPTVFHEALNERNYGIFTGKNKWQVKEEVGEVEFQKIRRSWNYPIPEGETLEDVYNRVVPFYEHAIKTDLEKGRNVIIVAHGNSLRALAKHLENLSEEEVLNLEIGIAEAHIYEIGKGGKVISKEIRAENPKKGKL
jgi:2,3-bisphosphoglycerate-dependent phosphoglycerate mutase